MQSSLQHPCKKNQPLHGFIRLWLLVEVHIHQLPPIRCRCTQKRIHPHLLKEGGKIWGVRLGCGRDLGRVVCQNPLCILPGFIIVVEDLHNEFLVGQILAPPFLQFDLRACPRFDALHALEKAQLGRTCSWGTNSCHSNPRNSVELWMEFPTGDLETTAVTHPQEYIQSQRVRLPLQKHLDSS